MREKSPIFQRRETFQKYREILKRQLNYVDTAVVVTYHTLLLTPPLSEPWFEEIEGTNAMLCIRKKGINISLHKDTKIYVNYRKLKKVFVLTKILYA